MVSAVGRNISRTANRGHDVALAAHAHHQAVDDCQGQRQLEEKGGAAPHARPDFDSSAQLLDVPPDHVHAHAASGNVGDLGRGGETRLENQVEDLVFGELFFRRDQPLLNGLGLDFGGVQPAAVVADFDDHLAGLVLGLEQQARPGFLPQATRSAGISMP
jgi:hypothetical protein